MGQKKLSKRHRLHHDQLPSSIYQVITSVTAKMDQNVKSVIIHHHMINICCNPLPLV